MSLKPLDAQINILQMNNAAKEITKGKDIDSNKQNIAASLVEKDSLEKSSKVDKTDKVESTIAPLENEVKDDRNKNQNSKNDDDSKSKSKDGKDSKLFDEPLKGLFIDLKE